jgi:hypothetical protein
MSVPKYGLVRWRDAAALRKKKLRPDKLTKELPMRESLGWLMSDGEGTIAVIHDHIPEHNGNLRRDVEFTIIPASWVVGIIALEEVKVAVVSTEKG